jgi:hypothetical protein
MDPGNDDGEGPPFGSQHASLEALFSGHFRWISLDVPKVAFPGREGREMVVEMERVP